MAVQWSATGGPSGVTVSPSSGSLTIAAATGNSGQPLGCNPSAPPTQDLTIGGTTPGSYLVDIHLVTSGGTVLPPVVVDVHVTS